MIIFILTLHSRCRKLRKNKERERQKEEGENNEKTFHLVRPVNVIYNIAIYIFTFKKYVRLFASLFLFLSLSVFIVISAPKGIYPHPSCHIKQEWNGSKNFRATPLAMLNVFLRNKDTHFASGFIKGVRNPLNLINNRWNTYSPTSAQEGWI